MGYLPFPQENRRLREGLRDQPAVLEHILNASRKHFHQRMMSEDVLVGHRVVASPVASINGDSDGSFVARGNSGALSAGRGSASKASKANKGFGFGGDLRQPLLPTDDDGDDGGGGGGDGDAYRYDGEVDTGLLLLSGGGRAGTRLDSQSTAASASGGSGDATVRSVMRRNMSIEQGGPVPPGTARRRKAAAAAERDSDDARGACCVVS